MTSWWVHRVLETGGAVVLVSWIFWVMLSIVLHELAHGWTALWQGDDTPRRLGRMTANPLVHMGGTSLLVFALIGIAWGVMPTDPSRYRWGRRGRIFVAGAGPAMNVVLSFVALTALAVWVKVGPSGQSIHRDVALFLWTGGWLNAVLAGLNLLPVPPLDGSTILGGLWYRAYEFYHRPQVAMYGMFVLLVVFFVTPIGSFFLLACQLVALAYADILAALLGAPPVRDVVI
jgi:Zn-dependent protease